MRTALKVRYAINAPPVQCEPRLRILVLLIQDSACGSGPTGRFYA